MDVTAPTEGSPLLTIETLSKSFAGRRVLDCVSLTVHRGETVGLAGHNGSGKSTLVKILAGYHKPDAGGVMTVAGSPLDTASRRGAVGLAFVHQDLALIQSASVLENMCVESFPTYAWGGIHWRRSRQKAVAALERLDVNVSVDTLVSALDPTTKALIAIARAVDALDAFGAGVLVLDEPTAYLPEDGAQRLFDVLRSVRRAGHGVILVTHDLTEIHRESQSLVILRDGKCVYSGPTARLPYTELVSLIMDEETAKGSVQEHRSSIANVNNTLLHVNDTLLHVTDLVVGDVQIPDLTVERGEIVGITGLVGSGFAAPLYAIFDGREQGASGMLQLADAKLDIRGARPPVMLSHGVALMPADRLAHASAQTATVKENVSILCLQQIRNRLYRIVRAVETRFVGQALERRGLQEVDPEQAFSLFSGGTQQKIIFAKWLAADPSVLLLDEPTHGIDVGACEAIYREIREAAGNGLAVLVASGDHEVLAALCHRVLVLRRGRVAAILENAEVSASRIAEACSAVTDGVAGNVKGPATRDAN